MITIPGRITINIHPVFWLLAGLIGWFSSHSVIGIIVWVGIIFISVLVHELGHATTAIIFKQNPVISIVALGGVTSYEGKNLKFWQQFLIVLFGPIFGCFLFLLAWGILATGIIKNPAIIQVVSLIRIVNVFWTIVNLLPVLPLDGGQLLRIALEAFFGIKGFKLSLFIGMLVAFGISIFFFTQSSFLIGVIFFIFAFQAFDMWRKSKHISNQDRKGENTEELSHGEKALEEGKKEEARQIFENIREKTKAGMIFVSATHYLALIHLENGNNHDAYELLLSVKDHLELDALCLLQKLAFEEENFSLVTDLSSSCYQLMPTQDVALRNAKAFASLNKAKPAGGWLRQAIELGNLDLQKTLSEDTFKNIKDDPIFKSFFK
jgi:Zn-dependent protease